MQLSITFQMYGMQVGVPGVARVLSVINQSINQTIYPATHGEMLVLNHLYFRPSIRLSPVDPSTHPTIRCRSTECRTKNLIKCTSLLTALSWYVSSVPVSNIYKYLLNYVIIIIRLKMFLSNRFSKFPSFLIHFLLINNNHKYIFKC